MSIHKSNEKFFGGRKRNSEGEPIFNWRYSLVISLFRNSCCAPLLIRKHDTITTWTPLEINEDLLACKLSHWQHSLSHWSPPLLLLLGICGILCYKSSVTWDYIYWTAASTICSLDRCVVILERRRRDCDDDSFRILNTNWWHAQQVIRFKCQTARFQSIPVTCALSLEGYPCRTIWRGGFQCTPSMARCW